MRGSSGAARKPEVVVPCGGSSSARRPARSSRRETDGLRRHAVLGAVALAVSLLTGCISYSYSDAAGVRHVVGFVDLAVGPDPGEGERPSAVRITSFGLSILTPASFGSGVVLGYSTQTLLTLPDNSCIDLGAPGPCSRVAIVGKAGP